MKIKHIAFFRNFMKIFWKGKKINNNFIFSNYVFVLIKKKNFILLIGLMGFVFLKNESAFAANKKIIEDKVFPLNVTESQENQKASRSAFDQPIKSAEDGFGSQLAGTQIGLYSANFARGFSPTENGNILLNGMYYRPIITSGFLDDSRTFVGIGAQAFPFSAPSGIVNYYLPDMGNHRNPLGAIVVAQGELSIYRLIASGTNVIESAKLAVTMGFTTDWSKWQRGFNRMAPIVYLVPQWQATPALHISTYFAYMSMNKSSVEPYYYAPYRNLPNVSSKLYTNPPWLARDSKVRTMGILASYIIDDWTFRLHYFDNNHSYLNNANDIIYINEDDTIARRWDIYSHFQQSINGGEARISKVTSYGLWRSLTVLSWRGYRDKISYGESFSQYDSDYDIGQMARLTMPDFEKSQRDYSLNNYNFSSLGLSQSFFYSDKIESNVSLRHSKGHYNLHGKYYEPDNVIDNYNDIWLPSFSFAWHPSKQLSLYSSLSRGEKNTKTAPSYARNARELLPAGRTKQWDAGLHWKFNDYNKLIISYFNIQEPYYDLDENDYYRQVANYGRKGIELSYSTWIGYNLYVLAAAMLAPAHIRDIAENSKYFIDNRPSGVSNHQVEIYLSYDVPKIKGLSISTSLNYESRKTIDADNSAYQSGAPELYLNLQYNRKIRAADVSFRLEVNNLIRKHRWRALGDDYYMPNDPLTYGLGVIASF